MNNQGEDQREGLIYEKMRKFISIIDELRDFGLQGYISLPRIAVAGLQSAGKSSLLESIVGYDFLPRGEGIVTRRPLEMRLVHSPNLEKPYGLFDKRKDEKISDFNVLRQKIIDYTNSDAGSRKEITKDPIVLTIFSATAPDLSLVDLPGITKIPVKDSGQPENIEEITTDLVKHYIQDNRTIILCCVQANIDITASDAIKLARTYDKAGDRTICALTKVDLNDSSSDLRAMMHNDEIGLKYGYVAVKGRSIADIRENVTVARGLDNENRYFRDRYPDLLEAGLVGTRSLVNRLSLILARNIQSSLPQIIRELREKIESFENELRSLGTPLPDHMPDKINLVNMLVSEFSGCYSRSIKGKFTKGKGNDPKGPIGVEIRRLLLKVFSDYERQKLESMLTDKLIRSTFINYGASGLPGFPPFPALQRLLAPLLHALQPKATDLVERIYLLLESTIQEYVDRIFLRFPELKTTVTELALRNLQNCRTQANELVLNLLEAEFSFLYTSDEDYLSFHGSILPPQDPKRKQEPMTDAFVREIRERVRDYFELVYRSLRDSVPKAIGQMLLNDSAEKMQMELYEGISKDSETVAKTLSEPDTVLIQRRECNAALKVLKNCLKKLQEEDLIEDD